MVSDDVNEVGGSADRFGSSTHPDAGKFRVGLSRNVFVAHGLTWTGDEKKKPFGEGSVFISSSRSGVNQMLEIFSSAQDIALYKQKLCVLMRKFQHEREFQWVAAASAKVTSEVGTWKCSSRQLLSQPHCD
jgi:hypothetical protein